MSYAFILSPCLSLGLDLQCFTRLGKMVQRFIDTHFQRSAVRLTFSRLSCALMEVFHVSGIQPHPTNICFISNVLKNFQNFFNESDSSCYSILSPSQHCQVRQERQFQTQVSLLFLTFYARATIDSDPPR